MCGGRSCVSAWWKVVSLVCVRMVGGFVCLCGGRSCVSVWWEIVYVVGG